MGARIARLLLIILMAFLAITAIGGGIAILAGVSGLSLELLEGSPFKTYTIPGLALLVLVGGGALTTTLLLVRKHSLDLPAAGVIGIAIIVFEIVEVLVIGSAPGPVRFMQAFYFILGLLLILLAATLWATNNKALPGQPVTKLTLYSQARREWRRALWHGLPVAGLALALLGYWFGVADRYIVFLYYHDMGQDTTPFSPVTASRYWMAGLVAAGLVLVLYAAANRIGGRLRRGYRPPDWRRVWAVTALPLLVGVPLITMTTNTPTLPPLHTARVVLATLLGVGLALTPGHLAARHPRGLGLLALDGWGLAGAILCVSLLGRMARYMSRGNIYALAVVVSGAIGSLLVLLVLSGVRLRRAKRASASELMALSAPSATALLAAGLCTAHLLLPLIHYLLGSDGYFYITNSNNFFADNWLLQVVAWAVGAAIAVAVAWMRRRVMARQLGHAASPPFRQNIR